MKCYYPQELPTDALEVLLSAITGRPFDRCCAVEACWILLGYGLAKTGTHCPHVVTSVATSEDHGHVEALLMRVQAGDPNIDWNQVIQAVLFLISLFSRKTS